jgi:hypothetical protein
VYIGVKPHRHIVLLIALCLGTPIAAQLPDVSRSDSDSRALLNSERIAEQFGSYDIDVLEQSNVVRVSNLYSVHGGRRICRTFAVVSYPERVDTALSAEHNAILSGQSIGAVFTEHGWNVEKRHRYFGFVAATDRVRNLMGGIDAQALAVHVYDLEVSRAGTSARYATIAEIHHPAYMGVSSLIEIYGDPDETTPERSLALEQVLALTREKMN